MMNMIPFGRTAKRKPLLTENNMAAQLNISTFDLEPKVEMFGHDSQCHIWRKQNTISTNTSYQLLVVVDRRGFGFAGTAPVEP